MENNTKGIILAGGSGTRLYPSTQVVSKQLLPVYDKPMIYYPLSTLMLCGIREVLIITTPYDIDRFKDLLGNGNDLGIKIEYAIQDEPRGLADSLIIGADFIGDSNICLILGDNLFYGSNFPMILREAAKENMGATVFGYYVDNPQEYGVAYFDKNDNVIELVEKPTDPKSNYAIVGLYFYSNDAIEIAKNIEPSPRGEIEITDVNKEFLRQNKLSIKKLSRGTAWLDTGDHKSMQEASSFVEVIESRQGLKIACLEEVAYRMGFIDYAKLQELGDRLKKSSYGKYIKKINKEQL